MFNPDKEERISFKQAAELVPVPVTKYTVRNWALFGAHGVRLEYLKIGGRYYTSAEALQRFLDRCRDNGWQGIWSGRMYDAVLERQRASQTSP
jgi:hypothetical protein